MSTTRLPAEERRASLLSAACGLFASRSYHGTTTADIARAAGVTEPVLYRHFPSKGDLFAEARAELEHESASPALTGGAKTDGH